MTAPRAGRSRRRPGQPDWSWAQVRGELEEAGYELVAGVDEAGCGALAGPVVAAAALLPLTARLSGLRDSKQLSPAQREALYDRLLTRPVPCSIGLAYVEEIDRLNIFHAARLAMRRAVERLSPRPEFLLMDGHLPPSFGIPCRALVKGDAHCPLISAASILAKVYRDRIMASLAALYPHYGFEHHKGYGTPEHHHALELWGPSPLHRRSFLSVRAAAQFSLDFDPDEAGTDTL